MDQPKVPKCQQLNNQLLLSKKIRVLEAAKSQSCANQMLYPKKRKVTVALAFVAFLIAGDWIVRNLEDPDKISLLFLGPSNNGKS